MGGRFALTTLKLFPQSVNCIYLIAADGLVASSIYKIATSTAFMRKIFKAALNSYPSLIKVSNTLTRMGLLNKGLLKFAQQHLKDKFERERIYNSWTSFRKLKLSPSQLASISAKNQIPVHIVLSTYDRAIPISRIKPHLIKNKYLHYKTVKITHNKLFYYNFLNPT